MIYHDMWLLYSDSVLSFYDMKDGTLVNILALRQYGSEKISLLSDGRIGVAHSTGCFVISFVDSEVNRRINVHVMDLNGNVTVQEISVYEQAKFCTDKADTSCDQFISRVVPYLEQCPNDERLVMMFASTDWNKDTSFRNTTATQLLDAAEKPTYLNTPYHGWQFGEATGIKATESVIHFVHGKAIIVREKKIDGRWQLVSI